ncbi:cyclic nucleotide-binding domain-containing protein [Providencia rettgeri]|nr:cyclic nucleotide-binding domain-containing protein [Providencia rettgeri]
MTYDICQKRFPHAQSLNALKSCLLFNGVEDEKLALLLENCGHIRFKSGEILNHEGEPFKHCPLMISGQIEVYRHTYLGEEKIFGLFCTGKLLPSQPFLCLTTVIP